MITFNEFEKFMKPIENYQKEYDETSKALEVLADDCFVIPRLGARLISDYISLLSLMVNDVDEDIDYFVFECEYGKKPMEITYKDETTFIMNSIKNLYECIVYGLNVNKN